MMNQDIVFKKNLLIEGMINWDIVEIFEIQKNLFQMSLFSCPPFELTEILEDQGQKMCGIKNLKNPDGTFHQN